MSIFPSSYVLKCPVKINQNSSMRKIQLHIFLNLPRPSDVFKCTICLIWLGLKAVSLVDMRRWSSCLLPQCSAGTQRSDTHTEEASLLSPSLAAFAVFLVAALTCLPALLNLPGKNHHDKINKTHSQEHSKNVQFHFLKRYDITQLAED